MELSKFYHWLPRRASPPTRNRCCDPRGCLVAEAWQALLKSPPRHQRSPSMPMPPSGCAGCAPRPPPPTPPSHS
ncbi:hypothetical protein J2849_001136 [Azospirillum melinis]|nr:hypothetical protein [Azospirillum melinis]